MIITSSRFTLLLVTHCTGLGFHGDPTFVSQVGVVEPLSSSYDPQDSVVCQSLFFKCTVDTKFLSWCGGAPPQIK